MEKVNIDGSEKVFIFTCPYCQKAFQTIDINKVYCGIQCKNRAKRKRYYTAHPDKTPYKLRGKL